MKPRTVTVALVCVIALGALRPAVAQEPTDQAPGTPTDAPYGNRTELFNSLPEKYRPAENWREFLAAWMREEQPRFSQGFEELIIRDFFRDMKGGVFLDVGCAHPLTLSTTAYLERRLNWTGVAIDALEGYAEPWAKNRPNSKFVANAISDKDGDVLSFRIAGDLSSLDMGYVEKAWEDLFPNTEPPPAGDFEVVEVTTITLNTLLNDLAIDRIDFLSIDIEGAEPLALAGFDIQRYKPSLVCIERFLNQDALLKYFADNGYERIESYLNVDKVNWYFRPVAPADPFKRN